MPLLSRLSGITLSVIAGGVYYLRLEKWRFDSEYAPRKIPLLNTADCADFSTSSFPSVHPFPQSKWDHNWDNREPKFMVDATAYEKADPNIRQNMLNEATPTSKRNIILIRHGQYFMDRKDKNYLSLTPLGQEQAKYLGQRLANSGLKFDSVVMSTMTRAEETAKLILNELPPTVTKSDPLLEEGAPFPPEPPSRHWRPKHKLFVLVLVFLVECSFCLNFATEGSRIEAAFRKYIHRASQKQKNDSWELIVCHGNVIRYFVCRALQFPPEGWLRMSVGHCSITWLVIYPDGCVSVRSVGDVGHLPSEKVSF
uniref:Serine/threonine-protein phosphatase PGAM5, mitochondrial n=1 Tax=Setaria digitata TaxID=48799 RepID=A0A915Q4N5_9BILA